MTDKTPDQWPDDYLATSSEWRGGFNWAITQAEAGASTALAPTQAAVTSLGTTVSGLQTSLSSVQATVTTLGTNQAALSAAATRNPAIAAQNMAGFAVTNIAQATATTSAARLDQVAWERIAQTNFSTPVASVAFTLPNVYDKFRVEWTSVIPSSAQVLALLISQDGGITFFNSAGSYTLVYNSNIIGTLVSGSGTGTYYTLDVAAAGVHNGYVELDPSNFSIDSRCNSASAGWNRHDTAGSWGGSVRPTTVAFLAASGSLIAGHFRLLGARYS